MKTIIIRKPKFMRDDYAFEAYMDAYRMHDHDRLYTVNTVEEMGCLYRMRDALRKAKKAGGFLRMEDLLIWMDDKGMFE